MSRISIISLLLCIIICAVFMSCSYDTTDNFMARDLTVTPSEVPVGEEILVEFWLDINCEKGVTTEMMLMIDGDAVQTKTVHAEADSTTRVYFHITASEIGTHTVSIQNIGIEDLSAEFKVTEH